MEANKNLVAALLRAKGEMRILRTDSTNPHFGSAYASLAAVLDVIRGPLAAQGILLVEAPVPDLDPSVVAVDATIYHVESGESMTFRSPTLPVPQRTAQSIGSALTYARRYHLSTIFGLAPSDDDGYAASDKKDSEKSGGLPDHLDQKRWGEFHALGKQLYADQWGEIRHRNVHRITEGRTQSATKLTQDELDKLVAGMRKLRAQKEAEEAKRLSSELEKAF